MDLRASSAKPKKEAPIQTTHLSTFPRKKRGGGGKVIKFVSFWRGERREGGPIAGVSGILFSLSSFSLSRWTGGMLYTIVIFIFCTVLYLQKLRHVTKMRLVYVYDFFCTWTYIMPTRNFRRVVGMYDQDQIFRPFFGHTHTHFTHRSSNQLAKVSPEC